MTESLNEERDQPEALEALLLRTSVDAAFRQRLIDHPVAVLNEHGVHMPDGVEVHVLENTGSDFNLLLPPLLDLRELSETELAGIAGGTDQVSAAVASMFAAHAQQYQSVSAQAAAFHNQFVQTLNSAGGAYSGR
jgi:hypothetical protein